MDRITTYIYSRSFFIVLMAISLIWSCDSSTQQNNYLDIRNSIEIISLNGIKFEFVSIPSGSFNMGSNRYGEYCKPIHKVEIEYDFQMLKTEITVNQFGRFIKETGYVTIAEQTGNACSIDHELWIKHKSLRWLQKKGITWKNPGFRQKSDHPVVLVTLSDAIEFCKWLSAKTNSIIRLPSEAEWEYASRAGDTIDYPDNIDEYAWHAFNNDYYTKPVATKKPNNWGLYDMLGNVWEMCLDKVNYGYKGAPVDGSPWLTSNKNYTGAPDERRVRGGAYCRAVDQCSYSIRYFTPGKSINYGFRVVRIKKSNQM